MKALSLALLAGVLLAGADPAEAARCAYGKVYRPSLGVCQGKAAAQRAGVYRPRYAKASTRHRHARRPPVRRAAPVETNIFENHVWNWAYDNRAILEATTP